MIGIIGAMDKEIDDIKAIMTGPDDHGQPEVEEHAGMRFWHGMLSGQEIILVRSGVGKVNAAVAAEALAAIYKVKAIINTGIAGSLDPRLDIGDIVLSTDALEHDMDVTSRGFPKGTIPQQDISIFEADPKLRTLAGEAVKKACPEVNVFEGRVLSGDIFVSDDNMKNKMIEKFGGLCTEMEGAAIAHTAWLNKIPYLIIRSISDKADDSAHMDYSLFQKQATRNSVKLITELLKRIDYKI